MADRKLSDLWWLRTQGRRHKYVCPLLMTLSCWGWRLRGKNAYWRMGGDLATIVFANPKGKSIWEAPGLFPKSWVHAECQFWNSRAGTWLRFRGVGIRMR